MFHHFVRARLHRRLFVWFTLAMVITGLAVGGVGGVVGHFAGVPSWRQNLSGAESFVRARFSRVWSIPEERDALALDLAQSFSLRVELLDSEKRPLKAFGEGGARAWTSQAIRRDNELLGYVRVGPDGRHSGWPLRAALPLGIAIAVIWAFAGAISRRIAWPFFQLAQVARDLGAGKLKSRAPLRRQFGEARALAQAMNEMADRIERQLGEQRELLAAVSHELRTPLARIRLLVELLRTGRGDPKLLGDLDGEVIEIDRLVGELLASARVEFGALTLTLLDPSELAGRALERAGLSAGLVDASPSLARFQGDATLLLRALANLLDNARRHGRGPTRLKVSADEGQISFEVEDAGPGFPPGEERHAFQPFRLSQSAAPREAGSLGLGLSLVERIARAHGGDAFAQNRSGGGASVGFRLPITPR